jgi:hypothetical protein
VIGFCKQHNETNPPLRRLRAKIQKKKKGARIAGTERVELDVFGKGRRGEPRLVDAGGSSVETGVRVTASQTPRNQPPRRKNVMNKVE